MNLPVILSLEGFGIIFIISIICLLILSKLRTNKILYSLSWPLPRLNINYENISSLYRDLNENLKKRREIPPAAEWLLDNFYIIEEQVKCIRKDLSKKNYSKLPGLKSGPHKSYARIYTIITDLISQTDGQLDENTILKYLTDYQSQNKLFDGNLLQNIDKPFWREKFRKMVNNVKNEIKNHLPGLIFLDKIPEDFFSNISDNMGLKTEIRELAAILKKNLSLRDLPSTYNNTLKLINNLLANQL